MPTENEATSRENRQVATKIHGLKAMRLLKPESQMSMMYQESGTATTNESNRGPQKMRSISPTASIEVLPMILRMPISFYCWRIKKSDIPTNPIT